MQGDMQAIEDSQDNMSPSVTRGTGVYKVIFPLGSTPSRRESDGQNGFPYLVRAIVVLPSSKTATAHICHLTNAIPDRS
jgi:hypothetical protein